MFMRQGGKGREENDSPYNVSHQYMRASFYSNFVEDLNCIKLYLTKFSEKESRSTKISCTLYKYCICKLLYMTVRIKQYTTNCN